MRIIYKEGREGGRTIEDIEGIALGLMNGMTALVFPKYSKEMLSKDRRIRLPEWEFRCQREFHALANRRNNEDTKILCGIESPAAMHTARFRSGSFGAFALPTLMAALEIDARKGGDRRSGKFD